MSKIEEKGVKRYIVDASVIAKWFIEENDSDKAEFLREAFVKKEVELICPSLLQFEVLNALKYSNLFNKDDLSTAAESLEGYSFIVQEIKGEIQKTMVQIAVDHELSIYDAAYLSIAISQHEKMITADDKIERKIPVKFKKNIIALSAFQ